MKALISYTKERHCENSRVENIDTLQELLDLVKKEKNPLIILNYDDDCIEKIKEPVDFTIEVYNDYRE